ncbi:MAG: DUF2778 domain-containing protein [Pseudolabrys sp.]|nr:DUF2778 domain-containing protein [Pseudolabrys sp.]MDP2297410.1 DUF2778 domain-containing protein [Pseudolabrys sp.]
MSDLGMARTGRPALAASARPASLARISFAAAWVGLGVAGVSAVAAAAIYLPLPQGRSVLSPDLRSSFSLPPPEVEFADTWREREQSVGMAALGLRAGQDTAWRPEGGLSTLLATRFPHAGRVKLPLGVDLAAPLPLPRPNGIEREGIERQDAERQDVERQDVAREGVTRVRPVAVEPRLASLPPQPNPQTKSEPGIFDRLFADPDRAAKAILAANPKTVLYDIVKKTAYMPDGEKLEAHSGFGKFMDDPESMHRRDVGVTPPNVYTVSFREKPFHGVRALRMKPVGGGNMYGRDGFLTHSFLLGTNGESNGCISLRDYDKFLQAYEDGKFDRIIVLRSADEPLPAMVASNQGSGT